MLPRGSHWMWPFDFYEPKASPLAPPSGQTLYLLGMFTLWEAMPSATGRDFLSGICCYHACFHLSHLLRTLKLACLKISRLKRKLRIECLTLLSLQVKVHGLVTVLGPEGRGSWTSAVVLLAVNFSIWSCTVLSQRASSTPQLTQPQPQHLPPLHSQTWYDLCRSFESSFFTSGIVGQDSLKSSFIY